MRPALARRRDRGFSLLVVFLLILVMIGVSATVILSTQQDLSVAGHDRESLQAFYAAEYAVAQAKEFLATAAAHKGMTPASFAATGWTPILGDLADAAALQGCASGPVSATPRMAWSDFAGAPFIVGAGRVRWRFCIHNNAGDLAYVDPRGAGGDVSDARDPLHLVTIEAWGASPGAAQAHLAVDVGTLALATASWSER